MSSTETMTDSAGAFAGVLGTELSIDGVVDNEGRGGFEIFASGETAIRSSSFTPLTLEFLVSTTIPVLRTWLYMYA